MPKLSLTEKVVLAMAILLIVVLLALAAALDRRGILNPPVATSTPSVMTSLGGLTFPQPADFGLAVTPEQVLVKSYIPPCESNFDYCFYYLGDDFAGTNFESAGIRVLRRSDLSTPETCLNTLPLGYSNIFPTTKITPSYSASVSPNLGDAAAGHYTNGELYRLNLPDTCFEIEVRRGFTQFANYPAGSVREFAKADRDILETKVNQIIKNITLTVTDEKVVWPENED